MPKQVPILTTQFEVTHFVNSNARHTHSVKWGNFIGTPNERWVKKTLPEDTPDIGHQELLAQEFFRLLIPEQPKTLLYRNEANTQWYIMSQEVRGYRSLPYYEQTAFSSGAYTGLGKVVVGAMFLQEVDLKNGNIGLNENNQVIKIDGDWCFDGLYSKDQSNFKITTDSIAYLPVPKDYCAFNWLDFVKEGMKQTGGELFDPELSQNPLFRREVNETILKICLLPDEFITTFVRQYVPKEQALRLIRLIQARRDELQKSAVKDPSFKSYIVSLQSDLDKTAFVVHMVTMVEDLTQTQRINTQVEERMAKVAPKRTDALLQQQYTEEINKKLEQLLAAKNHGNFVIEDPHVDAFYRGFQEIRDNILKSKAPASDKIVELQALGRYVDDALAHAKSTTAESAKRHIYNHRNDNTGKSYMIQVLTNTPLMDRQSDEFKKRCSFAQLQTTRALNAAAREQCENKSQEGKEHGNTPSLRKNV